MDELESLIAGMLRLEPSAELDRRIEALVKRTPRRNLHRRRARWLVATSACAGAIGFVLGRQTVPRDAEAVASSAPHAHAPERTAPPLEILASEDQLAGFFIVETAPENAWGPGRPRVEVFSPSSHSRNLP